MRQERMIASIFHSRTLRWSRDLAYIFIQSAIFSLILANGISNKLYYIDRLILHSRKNTYYEIVRGHKIMNSGDFE